LCGFKLLILLVDSFPNVVNVIMSNNTVLKQRKNYIDASFITFVIYKKAVLALTGFKTCLLLFSRFLEHVDFSPNPINVMCNNFLQQMEIDALEQLISEDVKVQGKNSCVMVSELASWSSESSPELLPESLPEEMMSTNTTLLPGSSLEESALTSMRADRFFLSVEGKTLPLHGGCRWSPCSPQCAWTASSFALSNKTLPLHGGRRWSLPTWPLRAFTASSPGPTKNRPFPWSTEEDTLGRRARTTPLHHRGTSLSWRGRRTTPRKTDGDVAEGPPPCRNSP
jgi:hypothetical protein